MYTIKRSDNFGVSYILRDISTKKMAIIIIDNIINKMPSAINKITARGQYSIIKEKK